jgi:Zn-dependent peptidase ImmA (M78 family)
VLHKHGGPHQGRDAETEANNFASSFLMPQADVRSRLPFVSKLADLVVAKKRWGVSVAALAYRLHKLGILAIGSNVQHPDQPKRVAGKRTEWFAEGAVCRLEEGLYRALERQDFEEPNCDRASSSTP